MTTVTPVLPQDKFDTTMTFTRPENAPTRVALDKLAVLPGFNTRVKDSDYSERVVGIAESIVANGFFDDKPFAVVMIPGNDTVFIYDGEHRFDAAKQAILDGAEFPDGLPVAWAKDGATVKDLTVHLAHGNNGEKLNMVELAAVVRRMQGLKMDKQEIATALGRTTRHVDNLFVLADASQQVKKAVASGQIAGAEAVKLLRKDKTTAGAKIAEAVAKAAEKGKAKATPKTMSEPAKPAGPRTKIVRFEHVADAGTVMGDLLKVMAKQIRGVAQIGEGDKLTEGFTLSLALTVIDHEAEAAAKAKADAATAKTAERAAAAEAKQKEREQKAAAKEAEKKAKEEKRAAEKKAAEERRAAEKAALIAAAKKPAAAKTPAKKGDATPKLTPAQAKAAAQAHLGTAKKPETKAASGGKTSKAAQKPVQADSKASGTQAAKKAETPPSAPETGESGTSGLAPESMGGL